MMSGVCFITAHITYARTNKTKQKTNKKPALPRLMFTCVLRRFVASTVLLVPNLSEGADSVGAFEVTVALRPQKP